MKPIEEDDEEFKDPFVYEGNDLNEPIYTNVFTISTFKPAIQPKTKLFYVTGTLSHTHGEPICQNISVAERISPQVLPTPSYNKGKIVRSKSVGFGGTMKSKINANINSYSKTEKVVLRSATFRPLKRRMGIHFHNYGDSNMSKE